MNIYIAYKYTHVQDKESLKTDLEKISAWLTQRGHNTFILGRDKKNWSSIHMPLGQTIPSICKNLKKSDKLIGYITGNERSPGLAFEMIYAKLIGKEFIAVLKGEDIKCPLGKALATEIIRVNTLEELETKLDSLLK